MKYYMIYFILTEKGSDSLNTNHFLYVVVMVWDEESQRNELNKNKISPYDDLASNNNLINLITQAQLQGEIM